MTTMMMLLLLLQLAVLVDFVVIARGGAQATSVCDDVARHLRMKRSQAMTETPLKIGKKVLVQHT